MIQEILVFQKPTNATPSKSTQSPQHSNHHYDHDQQNEGYGMELFDVLLNRTDPLLFAVEKRNLVKNAHHKYDNTQVLNIEYIKKLMCICTL